ncbi:DNA-binding protein [Methylorubrum thiocyanatum]|uniref:DNA-binding protein n=1 Tax=Methylorubrum thiocyanatum TaxID=47958 RepID=UPI00398C3B78
MVPGGRREAHGVVPGAGRFGAPGPALVWLLAAACGGSAAPHTLAAAPRAEEACRPAAARADRLADVGPRGELILASGRRAVLSGLHWPDAPEIDAAARSWLLAFRGMPLVLTERGPEDRWGRRRADGIAGEAEPVDLAGGLVAAGLGYAGAGEADALCRPALRALEAAPRAAGHGLWAGGPLAATDEPALSARAGRFVVVEGRILHVGERSARTYLDFARRGEQGLTVTVQKRTWRSLSEHGLSAATLKGRLVRIRGTVEIGRGPLIDLAGVEGIEVVEGERALRR